MSWLISFSFSFKSRQGISSSCKIQHSHYIFIFSSDIYVLIINECEVSQLSKPRVSDLGTRQDS